jgi:hypothetical protein
MAESEKETPVNIAIYTDITRVGLPILPSLKDSGNPVASENIHPVSVDSQRNLENENLESLKKNSQGTFIENPAEDVVKKPVLDYDKLFKRFISSVTIKDFKESQLQEQHRELIKDFLTANDARKLILYMDNSKKPACFGITTSLPNQTFDDMIYFIRESSPADDILTELNFERRVQYGKLTKNTMESLLKVMSHVYVPVFLGNKKWPDSVRKEFNNQLHKFMVFN